MPGAAIDNGGACDSIAAIFGLSCSQYHTPAARQRQSGDFKP
jgi:hypothetical protein